MPRALGAEIAAMLKDRGVEVIFGIPGVHNVELYRGIEDAGITHVLARHEGGAGFMADGYARATGKPGVAFVITGPGLTNMMTPMGQAYSDSVPLLVISSCLDDIAGRRGQLHQMRDQRAAAATVCDWSEQADTAAAAYALIDRALAEFSTGRARPRHIQVPISVLGAMAPAYPARIDLPMWGGGAGDVARVAEMLSGATRPLFVFGGGAVHAAAKARDVLRLTRAASFTTYAGGGIPDPDDPLAFGSYLGRPESEAVVASADVVIAVGTELSECDLWRDKLGHTAPMVRVDIDPVSLSDGHRADVQVRADAGAFLTALAKGLADHTPSTTWKAAEVAAARARWKAEVDAARPHIVPVCDALRQALPPDTMIFSDMTQFAYVGKEVWDTPEPGRWHHPTGFGTLGFALPAAIGGAVARRGQPTVVIAGDYGFQYTVQELGTAVELGLSLPILLWDNGKLAEIEDAMVQSQIAPNAVVARNPDFLALARAYGAGADAPGTLAELQDAVLRALDAPVPTLIRMTRALVETA